MKKILFLVFAVMLASCTQQNDVPTATQSENAEQNTTTQATYPSTVVDSPAAKFCESKGGKTSVESVKMALKCFIVKWLARKRMLGNS